MTGVVWEDGRLLVFTAAAVTALLLAASLFVSFVTMTRRWYRRWRTRRYVRHVLGRRSPVARVPKQHRLRG